MILLNLERFYLWVVYHYLRVPTQCWNLGFWISKCSGHGESTRQNSKRSRKVMLLVLVHFIFIISDDLICSGSIVNLAASIFNPSSFLLITRLVVLAEWVDLLASIG